MGRGVLVFYTSVMNDLYVCTAHYWPLYGGIYIYTSACKKAAIHSMKSITDKEGGRGKRSKEKKDREREGERGICVQRNELEQHVACA